MQVYNCLVKPNSTHSNIYILDNRIYDEMKMKDFYYSGT